MPVLVQVRCILIGLLIQIIISLAVRLIVICVSLATIAIDSVYVCWLLNSVHTFIEKTLQYTCVTLSPKVNSMSKPTREFHGNRKGYKAARRSMYTVLNGLIVTHRGYASTQTAKKNQAFRFVTFDHRERQVAEVVMPP